MSSPSDAHGASSARVHGSTVEAILSSGESIAEVCRELDLTETAVRRWLKQVRTATVRLRA